ncbi:hypothetical protein Tco_1471827 [Tanacetum coccineum]
MAVRTQPTLSPGMSSRIADAAALSPSSFCKRYRSSYETSSSSLTLPVRKRYRGTLALILDTNSEGDELGEEDTKEDEEDESNEDHGLDNESQGLEDEGLGLEEEQVVPKGQQQAVPVLETAVSEPLGLGYEALRRRELAVREDQPTLVTWVDLKDDRVYTDVPAYAPRAAPVQPHQSLATPTATISVDEDQFIEVGAQDARELYIRSGAIRDEIFSQRYRFRSLEREQERTTVTFSAIWRLRENHDLRRQLAEERRERLELTDRVARIERRQESEGEW